MTLMLRTYYGNTKITGIEAEIGLNCPCCRPLGNNSVYTGAWVDYVLGKARGRVESCEPDQLRFCDSPSAFQLSLSANRR